MSTTYDNPCPPPSGDEGNAFRGLVGHFEALMRSRFDPARAEVVLDAWRVYSVVYALASRGEAGKGRRILSDLNEEYRDEQFVDHVEWGGAEDGFRPWVLVPVREP